MKKVITPQNNHYIRSLAFECFNIALVVIRSPIIESSRSISRVAGLAKLVVIINKNGAGKGGVVSPLGMWIHTSYTN